MLNSDDEPLTRADTAELDRLGSTFTGPQYDALERALRLRAHVMGWLGDPLQQPGRVVLNVARQVEAETAATAN
jgi:hypothetical protein